MRVTAAALAILAGTGVSAVRAADGAALFAEVCAACHQEQGQGTPGIAPPIASAVVKAAVDAGRADYVPRVVLTGLGGRIEVHGQTYVGAMPSQASHTDAEIAALANHLIGTLNGMPEAATFTAENIAALRDAPVKIKDLLAMRKAFAP